MSPPIFERRREIMSVEIILMLTCTRIISAQTLHIMKWGSGAASESLRSQEREEKIPLSEIFYSYSAPLCLAGCPRHWEYENSCRLQYLTNKKCFDFDHISLSPSPPPAARLFCEIQG